MQHRHKVQEMLREFLPKYEKSVAFADLASGIDAASERARKLDDDAKHMDEAGRNPTTGVYLLIQSMAADKA